MHRSGIILVTTLAVAFCVMAAAAAVTLHASAEKQEAGRAMPASKHTFTTTSHADGGVPPGPGAKAPAKSAAAPGRAR